MLKPLLVPYSQSKVSILITTYNRPKELKELIDSIVYWNGCKNVDITVVDNNSVGIDYSFLNNYRVKIKLIVNPISGNLAHSRNIGIESTKGDYIFFIDDDNVLTRNTIRNMVNFMDANTQVGILSPICFYHSKPQVVVDGGALRHGWTGFTKNLFCNETHLPEQSYEVDEVSNAFMVRRSVFDKIGKFDEINFPMDLDEADLCIRAKRAGYRIIINVHAKCYHRLSPIGVGSLTFRRIENAYNMGKNRVIFQHKHFSTTHFISHCFLVLPLFWFLYCLMQLTPSRIKYLKPFTKGVIDGICQSRK